MTHQAVQFPFTQVDPKQPVTSQLPLLPLQLTYQQQSVSVSGLLDSGATVNVLPYPLGLQLGAIWDQQNVSIPLAGNLGAYEARGLVLTAAIAHFPPVLLVFAWTKAPDVRLLLGQVNFFQEFDVCFFRSRSLFEVRPK